MLDDHVIRKVGVIDYKRLTYFYFVTCLSVYGVFGMVLVIAAFKSANGFD